MLATPADMTDFALGFSLSERVVDTPSEIEALEIRHVDKGIELHFKIDPERLEIFDIKARRRTLVGTAGCGVCGLGERRGFVRAAYARARHAYLD